MRVRGMHMYIRSVQHKKGGARLHAAGCAALVEDTHPIQKTSKARSVRLGQKNTSSVSKRAIERPLRRMSSSCGSRVPLNFSNFAESKENASPAVHWPRVELDDLDEGLVRLIKLARSVKG